MSGYEASEHARASAGRVDEEVKSNVGWIPEAVTPPFTYARYTHGSFGAARP